MSTQSALAILATLLAALATGVATLTPVAALPAVGGSDKLHHMLAFTVLALPVALLRPRWMLQTALALALYGGLIELVQPFVGRSRDLMDWLANLAGIATGSLTGLALRLLLRRTPAPDLTR
ncbi:VanZ family protein [Pseudogemmobacter humi]|nr:VanZ family protein [Pseudogemmobacter humi]